LLLPLAIAFVTDRNRTAVFARYSLVGSLLAAVGALGAALPAMIAAPLGVSLKTALQLMFILYGALGLLAAVAHRGLPATLEGRCASRAHHSASRSEWFTCSRAFSVSMPSAAHSWCSL